jgi:RNA polymerase sigma-70 factor, ECF subfamily
VHLPDDEEVWGKICRGDAEVFAAFYRENAPRLQAFLRHATGNRQAAEDLTQETFVQIWNRPNGYRPERGALRAYLFGIGRKRAADWWRSQKPTEPVADESFAERSEVGSLVGDALRRLPDEQRALLWLREVEGQSYAELAVTLGIPIGTVRSRLFAAREALRTIWRDRKSGS